MDKVPKRFGIILLCIFASAVRSGEFSGQHFVILGKGTVNEAVEQVATVFSANLRDAPRNDDRKELGPLLQRPFKVYKSE